MKITIISLFGLFVVSCGSGDFNRRLTTASTTTAGAIAGFAIDDDSIESPALGALGGFAIGEVLGARNGRLEKAAYEKGYEEGVSRSAKLDYWKLRNEHVASDSDPDVDRHLYEIPVPKHTTADGTVIDSHYRVVEIID